ncbi:aminopeptidase N [Beijerinckia sp. L45]|uniref:aminopeptidase N n=1 Tax=Beijerinckia sp. L45 TaxID=1641855 RepID=UPI00131CB048|nr:aminopeptidase N [Beijerinckia sp. L45]
MRTDLAQPVRLADYRVPDYLIDTVDLDVSLARTATRVVSRLAIRPNPLGRPGVPLVLDGEDLVAKRLVLDGKKLAASAHRVTPDGFTLLKPPETPFVLEIETEIDPTANLRLMGLYRSGSAYCTQCEAEGFRRITYFLDRPDVLSVYTVRIEADRADAAILLSNGNPRKAGTIAGTDRHFAVWHDPHPKPSYLFALVGGNLGSIHDTFTTESGRAVALGIYVEPGKEDRAHYAMDALKRSMRWDETAFGREYDLDVFNIVAVSDFNMGAMENKGLNVFNDKYVLASPETATDGDYAGIETVIAHEYFHNWTGNRVTCRDWFQLCLKEGLTVFRDHEFSADMRSRAVRRIADVRTLRAQQFAEDAGPLAHNVRPDTYREINNFYTATIYEKGAEVIRMLKVLIGDDAFRRGMDLYFERCDGTATTIEVFLSMFEEAAGRDLAQFARWYHQAGTPKLHVILDFDDAKGELLIELEQTCPVTPGQNHKEPFVVPIAFGLLGSDGSALPLQPVDGCLSEDEAARGLIILDERRRALRFGGLTERPVTSFLRGFSAPVRLDAEADDEQLAVQMAFDPDSFNRWQASQTFAVGLLLVSIAGIRSGRAPYYDAAYDQAMQKVLDDAEQDPAFAALVLSLPGEADMAREVGHDVDPGAIHVAREALKAKLGEALGDSLLSLYHKLEDKTPYSPDAAAAGRRSLRNAALDLYAAGNRLKGNVLAQAQFAAAANMTDKLAALSVLAQTPGTARDKALKAFYESYKQDALVIDKWFALQAMQPDAGTLDHIRALMEHPAFSIKNPNRVRSLIGAFAAGNPTQFNAADGSGFAFVAQTVIELDRINAQVAARLLAAFKSWRSLEPARRDLALQALQSVANTPGLSADTADIASRSLA